VGAPCSTLPRDCSDVWDDPVPRWADTMLPSETDHSWKRRSRDHAHCQESTGKKSGGRLIWQGVSAPPHAQQGGDIVAWFFLSATERMVGDTRSIGDQRQPKGS